MPLQPEDIKRIIKGLIPENLSTQVYVYPTKNGYNTIELVNKKINYTTAYSVYDIIDDTIFNNIDTYIERVQSMEYLQDLVNTLKTRNTTVHYKHDPHHNRLNFTRSNDPRHYALIQTKQQLSLVWVASIKTVDKNPVTYDIVLEQRPHANRKHNVTKTLKQILDEAQTKTLDELTTIQ